MRNVLIFTIIGLLFLGCKPEEKRTDYIIKGNAKGVYNGVRAHLKEKDQNGRERILDTAIVVDEKFTFTGKVTSPKPSILSVNSVNGNLNFMLENSIIDITIDKANISQSQVSGSVSQTEFDAYNQGYAKLKKESIDLQIELRKPLRQLGASSKQSQAVKDSLTNLFIAAQKKQQEYPLNFIKANTNSYYSLSLIEQETNKKNANIKDYQEAFNNLSSELKSTPTGTKIKLTLHNLMAVYEAKSRVDIGKIAPNFEAPTPEGKTVSLNDIKGKVTIIDFWAAWCGPCRRENPNVVNIYNKYHSQGLEIIGVSLDGTRSQKDPKQAWVNAIEQDKLSWTHVSNLSYFLDPVAQLYNIQAIPAVFILDAEGKIAAKNLRGNALEAKVKELLAL
ncbi:Thiol:disulfide interchange protein [Winogradskyella psychrotolerans RS-3]|uniref:Thiol:disulfide interchange protein n=1 Tax=Winogradskyella psychrotolerans RS-3 TaxID=641526 RepID=S7X526_9FLAO|nr:TlpA disulfide reductase family protein [Winogradskyella psychrotolerans]EPR74129.1 Thiol:disulfide interchange protein [Winogradskyella psychrotolerans RS-3]